MSGPRWSDWDLLKHEVRYLAGRPRAIQWFRWKSECSGKVVCKSDSDWAGCRDTRKSAHGGCIMLNGHLLKSWSKNQNVIATSSGEAELYAASKGGGELLGIRSIAADLGLKLSI